MLITNGDVKVNISSSGSKKGSSLTLPFRDTVSLKKTKPITKYKKKMGDIWLGARKMSFLYLAVHYLLKEGKRRMAGFYEMSETTGKYVFIEVLLEGGSVISDFKVIDESPSEFLNMEGKSYDVVFGHQSCLSGCIDDGYNIVFIDFDKIHKNLTPVIRPAYLVLIVFMLVMIGWMVAMLMPEPPAKVEEKPKEKPPLTEQEKNFLRAVVSAKLLDRYRDLEREITRDTAFGDVRMAVNASEHSVSGNVDVIFRSYYPFKDSRHDGKWFVFSKSGSENLLREDIQAAQAASFKPPHYCLSRLIKYDTVSRSEGEWIMSVALVPKSEKDQFEYGEVAALLKDLYMCPISIDSLVMEDKKVNITVKVFTEVPKP